MKDAFCNECNNTMANNKDYFIELYQEINSGEYDKAFYNYVMSLDVDNFDFINSQHIMQLQQSQYLKIDEDFYSQAKRLNK